MKKYKLLLPILSLMLMACEEVLDKKPLDFISDETVWTEPVLIDGYLDQCYAEMVFAWETRHGGTTKQMPTGLYTWFEQTHSITISDEAMPGWVSAPKTRAIEINGGIMEWWGYATVRKLNVFLERLEPLQLNADYKKKRIAEARFLRAFCYFNMVKRYGGVPLITKAQQLNDSNEELYRKRNNEVEIYDFILSELDAASIDLPETAGTSELGRATKYAALALKSRAAMYAGSIATWGTVGLDGIVGIPQFKSLDYWQASYDASKAIISSQKFELYNKSQDKVENFRNLFLDENNSEVIFAERFNGASGKGHSYDMFMVPYSYHVWAAGQQAAVYLEMVESFENIDGSSAMIDRNKIAANYSWTLDELFGKKDPRFKASVYTQGTSWMNGQAILDYHYQTETSPGVRTSIGSFKGVLTKTQSANAKTAFGVLKYLDEAERSKVMERNQSDTDYIIFRLGEIYLNYAEAAVELGINSDALWAVNELRKRAGVPVRTAVSRDLVRSERKVELAFEGNRYWDLRRWRIATNELSQAFRGLKFILDGASYQQGNYNPLTAKYKLQIDNNIDGSPVPYFNEKHYYLPITKSRTAINPNMVENPGYK
jgi:hypothetical protein